MIRFHASDLGKLGLEFKKVSGGLLSVVDYPQGFTCLFTPFLVADKVNFSLFRQLLSQNMFILKTFKCLLK